MRDSLSRALLTLTVIAIGASARGIVLSQGPPATLEVPWIESLKPSAFDDVDPVLDRKAVAYRIDATVLLPLLFTSVPLVTRDAVGIGSFTSWNS